MPNSPENPNQNPNVENVIIPDNAEAINLAARILEALKLATSDSSKPTTVDRLNNLL